MCLSSIQASVFLLQKSVPLFLHLHYQDRFGSIDKGLGQLRSPFQAGQSLPRVVHSSFPHPDSTSVSLSRCIWYMIGRFPGPLVIASNRSCLGKGKVQSIRQTQLPKALKFAELHLRLSASDGFDTQKTAGCQRCNSREEAKQED